MKEKSYSSGTRIHSFLCFWYQVLDYSSVAEAPPRFHLAWSTEMRFPWRQGPGVVMVKRSRSGRLLGRTVGLWWPTFQGSRRALQRERQVLLDLEPADPDDLNAWEARKEGGTLPSYGSSLETRRQVVYLYGGTPPGDRETSGSAAQGQRAASVDRNAAL